MLLLGFVFAIMAAAAVPVNAGTRSECADEVCIHVSQSDDRVVIEASNRHRVPVGVRIRYKRLTNLLAVPNQNPRHRLVPPNGRALIATLVRQNARAAAAYPFEWQWVWGDPMARHDPKARYRIPFGGLEPRVLSQGVAGGFSHTGASKYAFDFAMPIGTPILAARSGRVVDVADGYTKAGTAQKMLREANAVTVLHEDGSFATYAHLDPGSGVRPGMAIRAGEVIGFSGNTGFSTGPHLHFSVWKSAYDSESASIPILFRDDNGRDDTGRDDNGTGFVPRERVAYAPGCHREGIPCLAGQFPEALPAQRSNRFERDDDGICRCKNGAVITTHLPCRMVCP